MYVSALGLIAYDDYENTLLIGCMKWFSRTQRAM